MHHASGFVKLSPVTWSEKQCRAFVQKSSVWIFYILKRIGNRNYNDSVTISTPVDALKIKPTYIFSCWLPWHTRNQADWSSCLLAVLLEKYCKFKNKNKCYRFAAHARLRMDDKIRPKCASPSHQCVSVCVQPYVRLTY